MALFKISQSKLNPVKEVKFESFFDREKKLQNLTEDNLKELFGLEFIATEFNLETFWLDSLAYDPTINAFVIIEYKKVENFSLMDQGQTYLNLVLDHKADVLLKYLSKTHKTLDLKDIDWSQTRVMFIGPKFNTYQRRALSPRLPFELWEVAIYEGGLIEYDQILPVGGDKKTEKKAPSLLVGTAAKEITVYTEEDLVKPTWEKTRELLKEFEELLLQGDIDTKIKYNKYYIAYISKHGRNYVEIEPQQQGLRIYYRFPSDFVPSRYEHRGLELKLEDCSKVGRKPNGISRALITKSSEIPEAVDLAKESFFFLHKDIYPDRNLTLVK